jgi:uncharacterized protein (DUF3084 family)
MTALIGGLIALILGFIGISIWWGYFLKALAAGVPIILILGGALATYLGIEEIKDRGSSENFEPDKDGLKNEVESLKEEIKDLKEEKKELTSEKKEVIKPVKEEKKQAEKEEKQDADKEEKTS